MSNPNTFNNSNLVTFVTPDNGSIIQNGAIPTSFIGSFNQNSIDSDADSFLRLTNLTGSSNSNLQTSSQIKKSTYVSKNTGCGGFNNVCKGQHIVSLM